MLDIALTSRSFRAQTIPSSPRALSSPSVLSPAAGGGSVYRGGGGGQLSRGRWLPRRCRRAHNSLSCRVGDRLVRSPPPSRRPTTARPPPDHRPHHRPPNAAEDCVTAGRRACHPHCCDTETHRPRPRTETHRPRADTARGQSGTPPEAEDRADRPRAEWCSIPLKETLQPLGNGNAVGSQVAGSLACIENNGRSITHCLAVYHPNHYLPHHHQNSRELVDVLLPIAIPRKGRVGP